MPAHLPGGPARAPGRAPGDQVHRGLGLSEPLFPSTIVDISYVEELPYRHRKIVATHQEPIFSPAYLHDLLTANGGYLGSGCGSGVEPWALASSALPKTIPTPSGEEIALGPEGIGIDYLGGFDQHAVDRNLANNLPTIVGRQIVDAETGDVRFHVNVVTGYNAATGKYLSVDPVNATGRPFSTGFADDEDYERWLGSIVTTIDTYPILIPRDHTVLTPSGTSGAGLRSAATVDVELGAVLPDGTPVGYDPATGQHHQFRGNFDWDTFTATPIDGPAVPPGPSRTAGLMTTDLEAGVVRTRIVPTADGPYSVQIRNIVQEGIADHQLAVVTGSGSAGEEIKHEITRSDDGSAVAVEVEDFSPEVVVEPVRGTPVAGGPVRFEVLGRTRCTATTNANGVARCQALLLDGLLAVLFPYTARYDGDEVRLPSWGQARLLR